MWRPSSESFNFVLNEGRTTKQNAQKVLGDTSVFEYFESPSNLAFHNLTGGAVPRAAKLVLGLSGKLIKTPQEPTSHKKAMEAFEASEKSICWKVLFAGEEQNFNKSKLYVKSNRMSPTPPSVVDKSLCKLEIEIKRLFNSKNKLKVKPNLSSFQLKNIE